MVVCDGIAPNDGKKLFEAMRSTDLEKPDPFADDLLRTLMSACKNSYQQKYKNADPQSVCQSCTYHMKSYRRVKFTEHGATQGV